jgi:hypothetical protein
MRMKRFFLWIILLTFSLAACSRTNTVCSPGEGTPLPALQLVDLIEAPPPAPASLGPIQVEIGGKLMEVDKVYVGCDARVAEAELDADANPLFLKGCDLKIAPNTVVYVAAHNDAAYYKGCSCHTGEVPLP